MIRLVILFATIAAALPFLIGQAAMPLASAVAQRFLERPTGDKPSAYTIPPKAELGDVLNVVNLTTWVAGHDKAASGYAWQLIPLDIVYLLCLGLFLGIASSMIYGQTQWPSVFAHVPSAVVLILPGIYVLCDLTEYLLIIAMLNWPSVIHSTAWDVLAVARSIKIGSLGAAFIQMLLLCLSSYVWPVLQSSNRKPSPSAHGLPAEHQPTSRAPEGLCETP